MAIIQGNTREGAIEFTRLTNEAGDLTKTYRLAEDGALHKQTAAFLSRGTAETVRVADLAEFAETHARLKANQAFTYGVTDRETAPVVVKDVVHRHPEAIARTRDYFHWSAGPGLLMLDSDGDHWAETFENGDALRVRLFEAVPALQDAPQAWCLSASSMIFNASTDEQLSGLRGLRGYIAARDATDIERAGRALYERLWSAGRGRFIVAKDGDLLDRHILDRSVFQPERIDFAAGARCFPPLEQRRGCLKLIGDPRATFDTRLITDLTGEERELVQRHRNEAREAAEPEARRVREAYIESAAKELAEQRGIELDRAVHIVREAVERKLLFADFMLYPSDGEPVTVGEVLDNIDRWHGKRFADPVDPDYRGDRRVAWVNLRSGGRPYLHSHAHGGRRFELLRQPKLLKVEPGELSRLADESLRIVRATGDIYDFGDGIARVGEGGRAHLCSAIYLGDYLGRTIRFERFDGRAKAMRPTDVPDKLPRIIHERIGERGLPRLNAVITAPTMRADGSVLDVPGYDEASGLLYLCDEPAPVRVPTDPSWEQVQASLGELWAPFAGFPFVDDTARGVMLAALMTAVVRRAVPTSPLIAFDAPMPGSGKSLLAKCVAALGGHAPAMTVPPHSDEEAGKALFAALREGTGAVIWDNAVRPIEGAALNAFLTAEVFGSRVLGETKNDLVPNRAVLIVTGNNLRFVGDVCRRSLVCRIDARSETPYLRQFKFDPLQFVRDRRAHLVRAALTILRGYQVRGMACGEGRLGSFEVWDDIVRQAVVWLGEMGCAPGFADPAETALRNAAEDPAKNVLGDMLQAWRAAFGAQPVRVGEVWKRARDTVGEDDTLREAIEAVADGNPKFNEKGFGLWVTRHKGQPVGGLRFAGFKDDHAKTNVWYVEAV